ncbi:MAG: cation:proton antiporter [Cyclobacteriaceae bacterium]|nr:cation:proton antiporter [Cyclobacteriaceae bacterium HetDA_MAG_MS6]
MIDLLLSYKELIALVLGFLIIAISANQIAKAFQKIHLPLITGLIFTGIIAGPYLLGLIPKEAQTGLQFINETALAFIAFAAGAELYLRELRSRFKSIKWNTFGQLVVTFFLGTIAIYFLSEYVPYMAGKSIDIKLAISAITAAVFVARSPASAIAVINELRAKGPFTQTVMGVTVVKDFLVIVLFSICLSIAQSLISGTEFSLISLLILLAELGLSFAIGFFIFGWLLKVCLSFRIRKLPKIILVLLVGYSAYLLSAKLRLYTGELLHHEIFLEPLLMCILASFNVTNYSRYRPEFLKILQDASIPLYVCFFTLTGATLAINVIGDVIGVALILFGVRMVTMIIGAYAGGYLAGDPAKHNHLGWMPYITQAGVALGLATVIANEFPEWGNQFATVIVAVIVINQFIGPPLFKWAIFQIGEDRIRANPEYDGINDAIIFGFESQSLALARQLKDKGWGVQIATKKEKGSFEEPEDIPIHFIKEISIEEFESMNADKTEAIVTMLSDEENLKICEIAYHEFGTRDLVVRLNNRFNSNQFLELDAKIVDPTTAIVSLMDHFVRSPQATSLLLGMEKGQDSRDIELMNPDLHGITLRDLRLPADVIILSIVRGGQTIISHGYTRLRIRDIVTVVGSNQSLDQVQLKFDR